MHKLLKLHSIDYRKLLHFAIYYIVAALMAYYFVHLRLHLSRMSPDASLMQLIAERADTPFQYRYLVPYLIKSLFLIFSADNPGDSVFFDFLVNKFEFFSCFLLAVVFRIYLSNFIRQRTACSILSLLIFVAITYNFVLARMINVPNDGMYFKPLLLIYDMPSILFFTTGLLFIYRRWWSAFYILFAIATVNRETTIFLTAVFIATRWGKVKPSILISHVIAQAAIWLSVKAALHAAFSANTGTVFDLTLMKNLAYFKEMYAYPQTLSNFAGMWLVVLLLYKWIDNEFVSRTVLVCIPFFIGMMLVGNLYEIRIFGELAPVIVSAFALILKNIILNEKETDKGVPVSL